jgi:hypothetical protein
MKHQRIFTQEEEKNIIETYLFRRHLGEVRRKFKTSVKLIKEVLEKNNIPVSLRKQPLDIEYFKNIDSSEKAYWLGFIVADGCIHKTKYKLSFCVKDPDILYKFKEAIGAGSPVGHTFVFDSRTQKEYEQYNLQINSKEFCRYIKNHGVDENKSKIFTFPQIQEKFYSHFMRGLLDGDGYIMVKYSAKRKNKTIRAGMLSTPECIEFIWAYLVEKLGFPFQAIVNTKWGYINAISIQKDALKFLNWLYQDSTEATRLDRKYKLYQEL